MSTNNFKVYSQYYDLLYADKNYKEEAAYIIDLVRKYAPAAKSVLEYGCGTGNHAVYLCEEGFEVTGLERSAEMVQLSLKKNIPAFYPVVANIIDYSLDEEFDVITALFHVISYVTGNDDLVKCFELANRHLNTGSFFIFDVWYGPCVNEERPKKRTKHLENETIDVTRIAEPVWHHNDNVIDVNYEIRIIEKNSGVSEVIHETHPMRYFTIPEIELLSRQTGFSLVKAEEFMTGSQPGKNTWGVCFILQKIKNIYPNTK